MTRGTDPKALDIAQRYVREYFGRELPETPYVKNDVDTQRIVAAWYDAAPSTPDDPRVKVAYEALAREVKQQFEFCVRNGVFFQASLNDPYANSDDMIRAARSNGPLEVYVGESDHPLLSSTDQYRFRAVHDYFGHNMHGYGFGPRGEHNAWIEHSKMFGPLAQWALTTETRGQNSWFNYGPYAELPPNERPFAEQKALLLPRELCQPNLKTEMFATAYGRRNAA